jgi:ABC-type nitrate/sulfonate/bicarbonate transport system permease component
VARETVRTFRLGRYARFRYLLLPSALPYLMTGVRLAASVALIVAITAELTVGTPGLGKEIGLAQEGGAIPEMYALVLVTGLFGVAVNIAMRRIERLVLAWHPSVRSEAPV